jgi:Rrf2 family protein
MKLSRTAAYAIHALVHVASNTSGKPVIGHEAAAKLGMPEGFLLRILVALSRGRILRSIKGPNGGYQLTRGPEKITLLDVIEAVEGPFRGEVAWTGSRPSDLDENLKNVAESTANRVRKELAGVNIGDFMKGNGTPRRRSRHG